MAEDIKKENNKDLAEKVGTVINKSFVKSFADFFKKNAEEKTEDARAAKLASKEREKSLKIMSGLWKQSKLTAKASKAVSKATDTMLSKWKLLVGLGLFLMPKEFWIKLKDGMFRMWNYLKGLDWGKIKTQVFDVLGSTIKLLAKVVGKISNLILGKKATRDEYDEQVMVLEKMKKKKGTLFDESDKEFKKRQKKQQELVDSLGGFDKDKNFIGKRQGGLFGENKSWTDVVMGLGTIALLLSPTGTLIAGLTAFKIGLAAVKWGKNKLTDTPLPQTDTKTTKTTQTKGQNLNQQLGGASNTAKKVPTPTKFEKAKGLLKRTGKKAFRFLSKGLGPAATLFAVGSAIQSTLNEQSKDKVKVGDAVNARKMVNANSRTPSSSNATNMMESGLSSFTDIPKHMISDVASIFSNKSSLEIKKNMDKSTEKLTDNYVEMVKGMGENIRKTVRAISKTEILKSKSKKKFVPISTDPRFKKEEEEEKSLWEKGKDWYDKKVAPVIGGNQHYGEKLVELQKMDTSAKPSTGTARQSSGHGLITTPSPISASKTSSYPRINDDGGTTNMNGVRWNKMHTSGRSGVEAAIWEIYNNHGKKPVFVSGLRDKKHSLYNPKSQHAYGLGFDLRSRSLGSSKDAISNDLHRVFNQKGWFMQEEIAGQANTTGTKATGDHFHIHKAAKGFHGVVESATGFIAGEAGSERVDITPLNGPNAKLAAFNNLQNQNLDAQRMGGSGGGTTVIAPQTTKVSQSSTTAVMSNPTAKDTFWLDA